jgi:hypothetical protein
VPRVRPAECKLPRSRLAVINLDGERLCSYTSLLDVSYERITSMINGLKKLFGGTKPRLFPPVDGISLESFRLKAQYEVLSLKEFLGDECFAGLRTLDRKIPSPGEIILSETHGIRLETIASNLKRFIARLDEEISSSIEATKNDFPLKLWLFMSRFDDLADVGSRRNEDPKTQAIVMNLLEYDLSLINELQQQLEPETIDRLVKRFSAREALRGINLRPYVEVPALPSSI